LKIAVLVEKFPTLSETFILNQITGLIDLGHDVDIYPVYKGGYLNAHHDVQRYDLLEHTYHKRLPSIKSWRNLQIVWLLVSRLWRRPKVLAMLWSVWTTNREALRLKMLPLCWSRFRSHTYDIVHCHFGPIGNLGAVLKALGATRSPVVVTFHGYDIRLGENRGGRIYLPVREFCDCVLSVSPYNRRFLESWGFAPEKIVDHPVGVDMHRFRPGPPRSEAVDTRILTVARLVDIKGPDLGLRAIAELRRRLAPARLSYFIVGEGPDYTDLLNLAERLDLLDIVHFYKAMEQEQVAAIMKTCDIYMLPSRAEALPVSVIEAAACGLPVVATDVGSVEEIVIHDRSGYVVPAGDLESMVDRLEHLCRNPRKRRSMGHCGQEHVEARNNIEVLNRRLEQIFLVLSEGDHANRGVSWSRSAS